MPSMETIRAAEADALAKFQAAAKAIEDLPADDTDSDLDALRADFDAAEQAYTKARDAAELYERTSEARKISGTAAPDPEPSAGVEHQKVELVKEPLTYRREAQHEVSIFADLFRRDYRADSEAGERLSRHMREMYDLTSTDSAGGYLVAPLWLQNEFVDYRRAGRVAANVIGSRALPPNTDSINLPTMDGGVTVAAQADGGTVSETDATFNTVAASVKTIAGLQDVSQQLLDRGVPGIDSVIFADLQGAYNVTLDTAVLNSAVASNLGLLQVASTNTATYTASTPTLDGLYPKIADCVQLIHTNIFRAADTIFMHPRRWAFLLASVDTASRPMIVPAANMPSNAAGTQSGVVAEGAVGSIQGIPVFVDPNIPTTVNTNQDQILVVHRPDLYLWEDQGGPYLDTFRDVGSGNLNVRFRLFNYYAQCHARRPKAISVLSGTGLAAPTF